MQSRFRRQLSLSWLRLRAQMSSLSPQTRFMVLVLGPAMFLLFLALVASMADNSSVSSISESCTKVAVTTAGGPLLIPYFPKTSSSLSSSSPSSPSSVTSKHRASYSSTSTASSISLSRALERLSDAISLQNRPISESKRFLLAQPQAGYSNRWYGVITSLCIALLTDRRLLIDWTTAVPIARYFSSPLLHDWDFEPHRPALASMARSLGIDSFGGGAKSAPVGWQMHDLADKCFFPEKCEICTEIQEFGLETALRAHGVEKLMIATNCDLIRYIVRHEESRLRLCNHFGLCDSSASDGEAHLQVFSTLSRLFFRHKSPISEALEHTRDVQQQRPIIGLQIRYAEGKINNENKNDYFISDPTESFVSCAQEMERVMGLGDNTMWFVATDNPSIMQRLRNKYPEKIMFVPGQPEHALTSPSALGEQKVVLDSSILSMADILIFSPGSTFGGLPTLRSGRLSYYVPEDASKCRRLDEERTPQRFSEPGSVTF